jgi:GNAT superfamily N-acetyltransferase
VGKLRFRGIYRKPAHWSRSVRAAVNGSPGCQLSHQSGQPDAILLLTAFVQPEQHGAGVGRSLVQAAAKDLLQRGTRAIEAFGDARWERPACLLPAEYLSALGFQIVRPHDRWPRLRLDLRSTVNWREDVEVAVERIMGSVVREPALRPV